MDHPCTQAQRDHQSEEQRNPSRKTQRQRHSEEMEWRYRSSTITIWQTRSRAFEAASSDEKTKGRGVGKEQCQNGTVQGQTQVNGKDHIQVDWKRIQYCSRRERWTSERARKLNSSIIYGSFRIQVKIAFRKDQISHWKRRKFDELQTKDITSSKINSRGIIRNIK